MTKLIRMVSVLFALVAMAACTKDSTVENNTNSEDSDFLQEITIKGNDFQLDEATHSSVTIPERGVSFAWDEDDVIGIFSNTGDQVAFAMDNGVGTRIATFSGDILALKASATYAAYYPYDLYNKDLTNIPISYIGQTQDGNANTDHIGAYDFMGASVTTPTNGTVTFDMQHLGCLIKLIITVPQPTTLSKVALVTDGEFIETGAINLSLENTPILPVTKSNTFEVALENIQTTTVNENVVIYFMMPPTDLSKNTLELLVVTDGEELEYSLFNCNFEAGKAYALGTSELLYGSNTISEFYLLNKNNPTSVICDVAAKIEDNEIKISSPYISSVTDLVANFRCNGYKVMVNGVEQKSGDTKNDFSSPVVYRVEDKAGNAVEYTVTVCYSGLPVVFVNTPNSVEITSKEEWTNGTTIKIVNPDGSVAYEGTSGFRGRGNSTWLHPKKPYAIKLDKKASILGMPKHKRWVLLANWMDRTLLRNRVAFKLGECTQMAYTPRGEYVELVLNGKHLGNYFLCEQIKIDKNRVNIAEINTGDEDVTGGYLLEIDVFYDEIFKFKSSVMQFPYMLKDPDEDISDEMFNYVQGYINTMEDLLYNDFSSKKWKEYMDINSFVDYWFAVELTSNYEAVNPKSVYMYKDRGGKLCAGPMWDYDWATFTPTKANSYFLKRCLYYPILFNDQEFVSKVKERWSVAKVNFDKIVDFIDSEAERIRNSEKMNSEMWTITQNVNGDETMTFDEAVARLKKAYTDKLDWLDLQIKDM